MYGKNNSSVHDILEKEIEICTILAASPQIANVMATVFNMYLVKMELGVVEINRKYIPTDSNVLYPKTLNLYKDFRKGFPDTSYIKPLVACRGYTDLGIGLD